MAGVARVRVLVLSELRITARDPHLVRVRARVRARVRVRVRD